MKIYLFSVATILVCLAFASVWARQSVEERKRIMDLMGKRKLCFYACEAGTPTPPNCSCSAIKTCEKNPCPVGMRCRMLQGVLRVCLKPLEVCRMSHTEVRPCLVKDPKTTYYYNADLMYCFAYAKGMCVKTGNQNFFPTRAKCSLACASREKSDCYLPYSTSACDSKAPYQRFSFDTKLGYCLPIMVGQCSNNNNEFRHKLQCATVCNNGNVHHVRPKTFQDQVYLTVPKENCELPLFSRACDAKKPSYYFNRVYRHCNKYPPGRCAANSNQFVNWHHCKITCSPGVYPPIPEKKDCMLPYKTTSCDKRLITFYYDKRINACQKYPAGECGINKNTFGGRTKCVNSCRGGVMRAG